MALVSVLWSIGLFVTIALSLLWNGNISYRLARNEFDRTNLAAMAEAVVNRAILGLTDPRPAQRWRTDGAAQSFAFNGVTVSVVIQDELGRIDLNRADASLLSGLFRSAGLDPQSTSNLVDQVLDWRENSNVRRLNGAKEDEYRAAGLSYHPRSGPFQSVDELLLIKDMTPALFQRLEPALTVYSGRQFIDPQVAPREALLALPAMTADQMASIIAARSSPKPAQFSEASTQLQGRAFTIRAQFAKYVHEAAIRLMDNPKQPYWVLNWQTRASSP